MDKEPRPSNIGTREEQSGKGEGAEVSDPLGAVKIWSIKLGSPIFKWEENRCAQASMWVGKNSGGIVGLTHFGRGDYGPDWGGTPIGGVCAEGSGKDSSNQSFRKPRGRENQECSAPTYIGHLFGREALKTPLVVKMRRVEFVGWKGGKKKHYVDGIGKAQSHRAQRKPGYRRSDIHIGKTSTHLEKRAISHECPTGKEPIKTA